MWIKQKWLSAEDSAGGSSSGGANAEVERYKREAAEAKAKLDKIESDKKKALDAKRAEEDGAKAALAELGRERDALAERVKAFEEREGARLDKALKALPEAARKKLEPFRDAMALDKFAALVEAEAATPERPKEEEPQAKSMFAAPAIDNRSARSDRGQRNVTKDVEVLLKNKLGRSDALKLADELDGENGRWTMPGSTFWEKMRARSRGFVELTKENAALRKSRE